MIVKERSVAKADGDIHYFTGRPCKNGHLSIKHVNGGCVECDKNRKKLAYEKDSSKFIERSMARYAKTYVKTRPVLSDEQRLKKIRDAVNNHYSKNKSMYNEKSAHRRAMKKKAIPIWFDDFHRFAIRQAYDIAKKRTEATGILWEVDHIFPLVSNLVCGLHSFENIQVIPMFLNRSKGNKLVSTEKNEWINKI